MSDLLNQPDVRNEIIGALQFKILRLGQEKDIQEIHGLDTNGTESDIEKLRYVLQLVSQS